MTDLATIEDALDDTLSAPLDVAEYESMRSDLMDSQADGLQGGSAIHTYSKFEHKIEFEVAMKYEPLATVMERYDVTLEHMMLLKTHKPFLLAVKQFQREIQEQGITFKMKAKMLAEDLIDTAYLMSKDLTTPASVRMDGIKNIVRWAELEPQKNKEDTGSMPTFAIQINL